MVREGDDVARLPRSCKGYEFAVGLEEAFCLFAVSVEDAFCFEVVGDGAAGNA